MAPAARTPNDPLASLLAEIRACRICEAHLPDGVRPVLRAGATAKICVVGQAPGIRVHNTGIPFNDPSGERLRDWMGIDRDTFYDERRIAIVPMGFCFPGYDAKGADKPPRKECARHWRSRLLAELPDFPLMLVIGTYAQHWHLQGQSKQNVSETVRAWREYTPRMIPLPHPSWRNNAWLKKNPWFAEELLPYLRRRVRRLLSSH